MKNNLKRICLLLLLVIIPMNVKATTFASTSVANCNGYAYNASSNPCKSDAEWYNFLYNKSDGNKRAQCIAPNYQIPEQSGTAYTRAEKYDIVGYGSACAFEKLKGADGKAVPTQQKNWVVKSSNWEDTSTYRYRYYDSLVRNYVRKNLTNTSVTCYSKKSGQCDTDNHTPIEDSNKTIKTYTAKKIESNDDYYTIEINVAPSTGFDYYEIVIKPIVDVTTNQSIEFPTSLKITDSTGKALVFRGMGTGTASTYKYYTTNSNATGKYYLKILKTEIGDKKIKITTYAHGVYTSKCTWTAPTLQAYYKSSYITNGELNSTGLKYFNTNGRAKSNSSSTAYQALAMFGTKTDSASKKFVVNKAATVTLSEEKATIKVIKKDSQTNQVITSSASFGIYTDKNCQVLEETLETNDTGTITTQILANQDYYYIKEIKAPTGYNIDNNNCIKIDPIATGATKEITFTDTKITKSLKVKKVDIISSTGLAGVVFELYDSECSTNLNKTTTTDSTGVATFTGLTETNYCVKEKSTINGYILDKEKYKVAINTENVISNTPYFSLTINKTDAASGNPIKGVKFVLCTDEKCNGIAKHYDGSEITASELTTDENGKITISNLEGNKMYYYYENIAAAGYIADKTIKGIKLDKNETVNLTNSNMKLEIKKVSNNDQTKGLPGATISIYNFSNEENGVGSIITSDSSTIIGIDKGIYAIYEDVSPSGYEQIYTAILIEVNENGEATIYSGSDISTYEEELGMTIDNNDKHYSLENNLLTIINDPSGIVLSKQDITSGKEIPGATIVIYDEEGNQIDKFISSDTPQVFNLSAGKYTLEETVAPDGYKKLTTKFNFEIDENGNIIAENIKDTYIVDGNTIIVFNDLYTTPITASTKNIILILLGITSIAAGSFFIYKKKKEAMVW